jgi:hypothetical protein
VCFCGAQSNSDPAKCEALLRASCASKGFAAGRRRCDASDDVSILRARLRPTFLPARPLLESPELRSPFQGGPIQEPHRFSRRASDQSQTTDSSASPQCDSRDPTPPPRPPLPINMVQDPLRCASCFLRNDLFNQVGLLNFHNEVFSFFKKNLALMKYPHLIEIF